MLKQFSCFRVPQPDGRIITSRSKDLSIRGKGNGSDIFAMPTARPEGHPRFHIPQLNGTNSIFVPHGYQRLPVRRKTDEMDKVVMLTERPKEFPRCRIPQLEGLISMTAIHHPRHEELPVRRKGEGIDTAVMPVRPKKSPCFRGPQLDRPTHVP